MRDPAGSPEIPTAVDAMKRIAACTADILRAEAALARREIGEIAPKIGRAAAIIVAGGVIVLYGVGFLLSAMFHGISYVLWPWLSALIVGEVLVAGGGLAITFAFLLLKTVRRPGTLQHRKRPAGDWPRRRSQAGTTSVSDSLIRPSRYRE